ncbi:MAG: Omp28-related outer membrane protein [Lentimicrobiaceae bacterium]|nr:Omp28-related outer membrane protein [Lentimicrobiaceae bacterium]
MKNFTLFLAALLVTVFSCNKIDTSQEVFEILLPVEVTNWDPEYVKTVVQKIYVEEYTGHTCLYCPAGAAILKTIMDEDPTVIVTAIHCTSLANPMNNEYFNKDYKTPMGDILCDDFDIAGLPKATINRRLINQGWGIDRNQWKKEIENIDRDNVRAGIELICNVDETKHEIEAKVSVTIIKEIPNPVQLCLVLQQDSIISGQIDGSNYILDYEHNHMLRAGFKGNYGIKLTSTGKVDEQLKYSTTFKLNYGNSFPYSFVPVNINQCSVVAYLLDMETKEVIQVETYSMNHYKIMNFN